jgi:hypothetical protein
MVRFYGGGLIALLYFAFWVWAIFDVIATDESRIRNLPKGLWLILVLLFGALGSIAWLLLGRPEGATLGLGGTNMRAGFGEPVWMQEDARRLQEWEDDLRRRERELGGGPDELNP